MTIIKHFDEMCYTIVGEVREYEVEFCVYEIQGEYPKSGAYQYEKEGGGDTADVREAKVYMHGFVKWDGCSDWYINEQDRGMLHGCFKSDLLDIGKVMGECWEIASKFLEGFDGDEG